MSNRHFAFLLAYAIVMAVMLGGILGALTALWRGACY
jgi:hypothetical protein